MIEEEQCRICMGSGDDDYPLISPCHCTGSMRYVHNECLSKWLAYKQSENHYPLTFYTVVYHLLYGSSDRGFLKCDICGDEMIFVINGERKRKYFSIFVSFFASLLALIIPIIICGFLSSFLMQALTVNSWNESAVVYIMTNSNRTVLRCFEPTAQYQLDRVGANIYMYKDTDKCFLRNTTTVDRYNELDSFIHTVKAKNLQHKKERITRTFRKNINDYWRRRTTMSAEPVVLLDYIFFTISVAFALSTLRYHFT